MLALSAAMCLSFSMNVFAMGPSKPADPKVVDKVDLNKYMGSWNEIAHYPNSFQEDCDRSTAQYDMRQDGSIDVMNTCIDARGAERTIHGVATVQDNNQPGKLKVNFGQSLVGDYWIIDLDRDYQYSVVSGPGKESLFILARQFPMPSAVLQDILGRLDQEGFDRSKLVFDH